MTKEEFADFILEAISQEAVMLDSISDTKWSGDHLLVKVQAAEEEEELTELVNEVIEKLRELATESETKFTARWQLLRDEENSFAVFKITPEEQLASTQETIKQGT